MTASGRGAHEIFLCLNDLPAGPRCMSWAGSSAWRINTSNKPALEESAMLLLRRFFDTCSQLLVKTLQVYPMTQLGGPLWIRFYARIVPIRAPRNSIHQSMSNASDRDQKKRLEW